LFIQISLVITLVIAQQMLNSNFFGFFAGNEATNAESSNFFGLGARSNNAYQSTLVVELVVVQTNANASNFFDSKLVYATNAYSSNFRSKCWFQQVQ
jgi:hypothetical protein